MVARTILALGIWLVSLTTPAATIMIDLPAGTIDLNTTFTVAVVGSGFPVTEGGGFSLSFDPSLLELSGVSIDSSLWDFSNDPGVPDPVAGTLSDVKVSAFPGVGTGDFVVARVAFLAKAPGLSVLGLGPAPGNAWASGGGLVHPVFDQSATIEIAATTVPLPATLWLLLSGLGFLASVNAIRQRAARLKLDGQL